MKKEKQLIDQTVDFLIDLYFSKKPLKQLIKEGCIPFKNFAEKSLMELDYDKYLTCNKERELAIKYLTKCRELRYKNKKVEKLEPLPDIENELSKFSDTQLMDEIRERGFRGTLKKEIKQTVEFIF